MSLQPFRPAVVAATHMEGTEEWAEKDTSKGNTERSCYWCPHEGRRDAKTTPGYGSLLGHPGTHVLLMELGSRGVAVEGVV